VTEINADFFPTCDDGFIEFSISFQPKLYIFFDSKAFPMALVAQPKKPKTANSTLSTSRMIVTIPESFFPSCHSKNRLSKFLSTE